MLLRREQSSAPAPPHPASADPSWLGGAGCFLTAPHMASAGTAGAGGLASPWAQSPLWTSSCSSHGGERAHLPGCHESAFPAFSDPDSSGEREGPGHPFQLEVQAPTPLLRTRGHREVRPLAQATQSGQGGACTISHQRRAGWDGQGGDLTAFPGALWPPTQIEPP